MLIQIDKLKRQPRQVDIDESVEAFPELVEIAGQGIVSFDERIRGTLRAAWAGDVVNVSGHLSTVVTLPCARCLAPVTSSLEIELFLCYSNKGGEDSQKLPEELEVRSEELGLIPYTDQEIDLRPDLGQEIVMAIPQQLLCRSSCKGLCPNCGINHNLEMCDCEKPQFHAGLAALKGFKIKQ